MSDLERREATRTAVVGGPRERLAGLLARRRSGDAGPAVLAMAPVGAAHLFHLWDAGMLDGRGKSRPLCRRLATGWFARSAWQMLEDHNLYSALTAGGFASSTRVRQPRRYKPCPECQRRTRRWTRVLRTLDLEILIAEREVE